MEAFRRFDSDEAQFWQEHSKLDSRSQKTRKMTWTEIYTKQKKFRKDRDELDHAEARSIYTKPEDFDSVFSYRKSGRRYVMKQAQHIARKFRQLHGRPQPWDEKSEDEEDASQT